MGQNARFVVLKFLSSYSFIALFNLIFYFVLYVCIFPYFECKANIALFVCIL